MKRKWVFFLLSICFLGCQKDDGQKFREIQREVGEAQSQGDLDIQNQRATFMERDLTRRHRFYQAIRGTYEGITTTEKGDFNVRMTLVPSLPPYPLDSKRIRTMEEVAFDLTNLHFNIHIVQWNPKNLLSAVGCTVEGIRPDMVTGEIFIASKDCSNFYSFFLSDGHIKEVGNGESVLEEKPNATALSSAVLEGTLNMITQLYGQVRPTTHASIYPALLNRVAK